MEGKCALPHELILKGKFIRAKFGQKKGKSNDPPLTTEIKLHATLRFHTPPIHRYMDDVSRAQKIY